MTRARARCVDVRLEAYESESRLQRSGGRARGIRGSDRQNVKGHYLRHCRVRRGGGCRSCCASLLFPEVAALNEALTHLRECALNRGFDVEVHGADGLLLTLDVPHADGVRLQYHVVVRADGPYSVRRETRWPGGCPSSVQSATSSRMALFVCIGLVSCPLRSPMQSAGTWLSLLSNFLRLQRRAAKQRCWPNNETWAHGSDAARQQLRAERAAEKLGPESKAAVAAGI